MTARQWFNKAQTQGFAIGAFNVDNLDILKAICVAGQKLRSPVMLEFSPGEVGYFGLVNIVDLVNNAKEEYKIPILLNLDHAKKVEDCLAVIDLSGVHPRGGVKAASGLHPGGETVGPSTDSASSLQASSGLRLRGCSDSRRSTSFDDIHYDGSELTFAENIENTKKVVAAAHLPARLAKRAGRQVLVEGEIDRLPGSSEVHSEEIDMETLKKSYTDPARAVNFVQETGVDILAAVFGNVHGTFPNQPDLDFSLLAKIREALPDTFLSMHGGSGIPAEQVREAIKIGKIVKVNVNTEVRQAFRDALGEELGESKESAYYKLTPDIINAVAAVVAGKIEVLGSGGKVD